MRLYEVSAEAIRRFEFYPQLTTLRAEQIERQHNRIKPLDCSDVDARF